MDKKLTTTLGIALGASLLAGAGFGIYKYFSRKSGNTTGNSLPGGGGSHANNLFGGFIGNGFVKSNRLYGGNQADNELIGGGLYKSNNLSLTATM